MFWMERYDDFSITVWVFGRCPNYCVQARLEQLMFQQCIMLMAYMYVHVIWLVPSDVPDKFIILT